MLKKTTEINLLVKFVLVKRQKCKHRIQLVTKKVYEIVGTFRKLQEQYLKREDPELDILTHKYITSTTK